MDIREGIDLTEEISRGDVKEIIDILQDVLRRRYDRIYWDGYDSSIFAYKMKDDKKNEMV